MRQFRLLDRRACLADLCLELGKSLVATDHRLQHVGRFVFEVPQHERVGTLRFQDFRAVT